MNESLLKPTWMQAVAALLLITVTIYLVALFFVLWWADFDPFAIIGVVMFAPLAYYVVKWQYRGTFQGHPQAARKLGVLLYGVAIFFLIGYVATVGEHYQRHGLGADPTAIMLLLWPILIPVVGGVVLGRINQVRGRQLNAIYAEHPELQPRRRTTLRESLVGVALAAAAVALIAQEMRSLSPPWAEHLSGEQARLGLPDGAADVSYCRGSRGTIAFEFTIDEPRFREWVAAGIGSPESILAQVPLEEITGNYKITRYLDLRPNLPGIHEAEVTNGLRYEWRFEDRGVHAAFDRGSGRAYYYAHYH